MRTSKEACGAGLERAREGVIREVRQVIGICMLLILLNDLENQLQDLGREVI